jgi:hypothetical protein
MPADSIGTQSLSVFDFESVLPSMVSDGHSRFLTPAVQNSSTAESYGLPDRSHGM